MRSLGLLKDYSGSPNMNRPRYGISSSLMLTVWTVELDAWIQSDNIEKLRIKYTHLISSIETWRISLENQCGSIRDIRVNNGMETFLRPNPLPTLHASCLYEHDGSLRRLKHQKPVQTQSAKQHPG